MVANHLLNGMILRGCNLLKKVGRFRMVNVVQHKIKEPLVFFSTDTAGTGTHKPRFLKRNCPSHSANIHLPIASVPCWDGLGNVTVNSPHHFPARTKLNA